MSISFKTLPKPQARTFRVDRSVSISSVQAPLKDTLLFSTPMCRSSTWRTTYCGMVLGASLALGWCWVIAESELEFGLDLFVEFGYESNGEIVRVVGQSRRRGGSG